MDREELLKGIDIPHALFGTLFAFGNSLQATGDAFYKEITSKQFFLLICLSIFKENPTINELSDVMGSSHQNVKVIADKLASKGYIRIYKDDRDRRKQRIGMTPKMQELDHIYEEKSKEFMKRFYEGLTEEEMETTYKTMVKLEQNLAQLRKEL